MATQNTAPGEVVTGFVNAFTTMDAAALAPFLHADVLFEAYGDRPIHGRDGVLALWAGVFGGMQRNIARAAATAERARTDRRRSRGGLSADGGS